MAPRTTNPLSYCLWLINRRLRSRYELDEAMKKHRVDEAEREDVLRQLTEHKLIDDRRFAKAWIEGRDLLAPRGEYMLRQELAQKGVAKELIDDTLQERREAMKDEAEDQPDEETLVRELIKRRARLYANLPEEVRRRRLMGFLQRRGFSYDVVRRILDA